MVDPQLFWTKQPKLHLWNIELKGQVSTRLETFRVVFKHCDCTTFWNISPPLYIGSSVSRYVFALQLRRMCYKDGVKLLLFKYQVLENLFRDWGSDITPERRACLAWNRDMIFISRSKLLSSAHYSKSQIFVHKFNFDKTPTFSRVFHPIWFDNFSHEIKIVSS